MTRLRALVAALFLGLSSLTSSCMLLEDPKMVQVADVFDDAARALALADALADTYVSSPKVQGSLEKLKEATAVVAKLEKARQELVKVRASYEAGEYGTSVDALLRFVKVMREVERDLKSLGVPTEQLEDALSKVR